MKLTRLRVENFRRFREPRELTDFAPGLNLFTGANEVGKSTLADAIRCAFFERHRSSSLERLRPWDEPSATPTVEIDFELGGQRCRLTKAFLGKQRRCELRIDGSASDGVAAEDRLGAHLARVCHHAPSTLIKATT